MASRGRIDRDNAVAVEGLAGLQRALRRAEGDVGKGLRRELGAVARVVRDDARSYVTHTTGRHGGPDVPHLAPSIRASVTTYGASIFSNAPHANVQNFGGRVGHGAIIQRGNASAYMTKAAQRGQANVERRIEGMLDTLADNFSRDD